MTLKNRIGILTVIVLITSIIVSILAVPASAGVDYSNPGATNKTTLAASDILVSIFGDEIELGDAERAYLDKYSGQSLTYSPKLPSSGISSEYDVQEKLLTVSVKEYKYTSVSGSEITWIPERVVYGEFSKELAYNPESGEYTVVISDISEGDISTVTVTYSADFEFSEKTLNTLLTKAYDDAVAWEEYAAYLAELDEYSAQLSLYKQYLVDQKIYDDRYFEYQKYLEEKAAYDAAKALFEKYEAELAKYNSDYALYVKYIAEKEAYDRNKKAYDDYVKNSALVKAQLAVIDGTDKGLPEAGRPLRGAILGPTVEEVINNKDLVANEATTIDGAVIDLAGESTEMLRELFDGYFSKKTEAEKYIYYSLNYEKFRDSFTNLLRTLDFMYQDGKVRYGLSKLEMTWKFQILLAQLYYVVVALNDSPVAKYDGNGYFDSTYTIDKKKPISYVENKAYVTDPKVAAPVSGGYPSKVDKPVEPTPVTEPTRPTPVSKPIAPNEVKDPGDEPVPVSRPTVPAVVDAPDKKLVKDGVISDDILSLIKAKTDGELAKRAGIVGNRTLTITAEATKSVHKVDEITVHFYDSDGSLLESVTAERYGYVEYGKETPKKTSDDKIYTFVGWQTSDGTVVDMSSVNPIDSKELSVYPIFSEKIKVFTVTWRVEDTLVEEEYEYGELPVYNGVPAKEREGTNKFVFSGWNRAIVPVTSNITYIAKFDEIPLVVDKNGMGAEIDLSSGGERYLIDCTENAGQKFDFSDIFALAAENMKGISVKFRSGTVTLSFSELMDAYSSGATVISLMASSASGDGEGASFKLSFTTPDGDLPDRTLRATVEVAAKITSVESTTLSRLEGNDKISVPSDISNEGIKAQVEAGAVYQTYREFAVSSVPYADILLTVDKSVASVGETVRVNFSAPTDKRIVRVYYIDGEGNKTVIEGGMFLMPAQSVTVGLEFEYVTYTVRFTSDGRVIHTAVYKPGEMPKFPGSPVKATDAEYTYTFVGWDREFSPVTGNAVYNAVYEKTPVVREAPPEGLAISPRVMRILVIVIVAAFYAVVVFLPCIIIVTVKLVKRCMRRRSKRAKMQE